ncbi:MAG: purine/pyrimidine permease, partial [Bacteroides sp.]|nr:purine/pyrimidine permease [Bacteroides sp.]
ELKYNLEDKPKLGSMLLYGLQWWVVIVPTIITMGLVVGKLRYGADIAAQTFYMQKLFFVLGVTLLGQILWGHRLPLAVGPASILLIGVLASVSSGIPAIYTAILTGGVILTLFSVLGLLRYLQVIFTTRVILVIMLLIPLTLGSTIIKLVFGGSGSGILNLLFALGLTFALVVGNKLLQGVWKATTLVWGILAGTFIYPLVGGTLATTEGVTGMISSETPGWFIRPEFDAGVILSFLFCVLVLIINEVGSIEAVGHILKADDMVKRTRRGVLVTGLSNILSGSLGVLGAVDYSSSPGIIAATRCASRYPFIPAAVLLVICAFIPSLVRLLLGIPDVVMGVVLLYVMTTQFAAGLQMAVRDKAVTQFDEGATIGLSLMVAMLISFMPAGFSLQLPALLRPVLGNGFVMGVITVLVLEHVVYRKKQTKGII